MALPVQCNGNALLCSLTSDLGDVISISKEHNPMIDGPVHNASHSAGLVTGDGLSCKYSPLLEEREPPSISL